MRSYTGAWSWQKDKAKYAIRAQQLAEWLATPASRLPFKSNAGKKAFEKIGGKPRIVFFQNYWGAGHQGDHIDLWNGSLLVGPNPSPYFVGRHVLELSELRIDLTLALTVNHIKRALAFLPVRQRRDSFPTR